MIGPATQQGNSLLDNATTAVAASAVASPVWLPWLHTASQVAATFAPILGAVWLVVQIWAKISEVRARNRKD
ncbi:hypothetical protein AWN88_25680 [Agrobacterium tumefaciens]|nr:hypothetical protein AWN88_11260 [Agrobacterium tumefaciens]AMD61449.1 hypothetical protein AWN88_25660 [Agrobacterium tumefaciens]AMD61453.1 hypothetical protein AWN88_25680 [Agrobacterium tumefaciens]KAJ36255.1 hypothetical protein BW45_23060 [Agrobacterium tumefaciens]